MVVRKLLSVEEWASLIRSCKTLSHLRSVHALLTTRHNQFKNTTNTYLSNTLIQAYGKFNSIQDAFQVFDSIQEKNQHSWNLILLACVYNRHFLEASCIFRRMPDPDILAGAVMIGVYARRGSLEDSKKTFDRVPRNIVSWNTLLAAYAQKRQMLLAEIVYEKMPMRDSVTWSTLINAYNQIGSFSHAKALFKTVPEKSATTWTSMLSANAQEGHLSTAKQMFDEMPTRDVVCWTALITGYGENAEINEAKSLFDRIPMRDVAAWSAMLAAYARRGHLAEAEVLYEEMPAKDEYARNAMLITYAQNGHIPLAKQMFDSMPTRDIVAWNLMLAAYAQNRYMLGALQMFEHMPMWDVLSWNTSLAVYAHNGHVERARDFFFDMPVKDLQAYNTLLGAYGDIGKFKTATELFDEMLHEGVMPDEVSYICMLIGCNHGGTVADAKMCFTSMIWDHNLAPMKMHYGCMIDILGRAGHLQDAEDLIDNMPFIPDDVDWHCLLSSCKIHEDRERGARAARHAVGIASYDPSHYVLFSSFLRTIPVKPQLLI